MAARRGPRLLLAVGVLAGLGNAVVFPATHPEQVALASDVYYAAGRAALHGRGLYVGPGFLYPPPVVALFVPHAVLGDPVLAFALQTAVNLACLAGVAVVAVRLAERAGAALAPVDRALVVAFAVASPLPVVNLVNGQVNPVLALAVGAGVLALEADRRAAGGAAFGFAALVKLFPALVGAWLLRRRAWRAIAAATAAGVLALLAGVLVFGPGAYETYVTDVLTGQMSSGSFPDGPDPTAPYATVRRQLALLAPGLSGAGLLAASLAVVAPAVAAANRRVATLTDRLVALQGTLSGVLLAFPLEPFYRVLAFATLLPLLYLLDGRSRRLLLAGALLVAVPVAYAAVALLADLAVLPPSVSAVVLDAARAVFSVVLPPTVGSWLVLAGCVTHQFRAAR
ncbi:MAG: glycosyltransferase family 87 protein [Halobacterium sp.]